VLRTTYQDAGMSEDLQCGLAAGQPDAFVALYRRYERPLLAFFVRRTGQPDLAADLTAETFAAALAGRASHRPGAPLDAWLFGIAQHKLIDSLRRRRVEDEARRRIGMEPVMLDDGDLERIDAAAGPKADVERILAELPAEQRAAVRARILEERSYPDIAGELRCSEAVVRKRVSRGLARLRHQLDRRAL
jgi:RNA polymerase sigma-70 factor (ECF subfamily)